MAKKILIIEDEKILREMYYDKFVQAGFDIILADSAEEGIELVSKVKPDLILLDILLPKTNGISFLTRLRKKPEFNSLPVVAFSNFDSPETKKAAFELGVKDYLIKTNFTPKEIVDKIKSYLK
ncbi:MAG: response regulator [Candidatus Nealsonbacteria bacterium]|nr:response regulator [Candidatus Nealsonbacteria bacterium]